MTINIGDKAPDFTLYSSDMELVSLNDLKGKNIVILFFPLAFSGICTTELCAVRDDKKDYESLNAEVFAISIDSPMVLSKFKELESFKFTLLSDFNKEVCRAYGAYYDEFVLGMKGVAKRSAFVIDKTGIVRYAEVNDNAKKIPDFEAVKESLSNLN